MSHATIMVFAPKDQSVDYVMSKYSQMAEEGDFRASMTYADMDYTVVADNLEELQQQYRELHGKEMDPSEYECYNSEGYFDWYQLGGRWSDFFIPVENPSKYAKKGERSWASGPQVLAKRIDTGLVSDIDWMGMMKNYLEKITPGVESLWKLFVDLPPIKSLTDIKKEYHEKGWDWDGTIIRDAFQAQPRINILVDMMEESDVIRSLHYVLAENIEFPYQILNYPVEKALEILAPKAFETYALLFNDEWHHKDACGYVEELPKETMGENIAYIVDNIYKQGLEDETVVYLVDYHY